MKRHVLLALIIFLSLQSSFAQDTSMNMSKLGQWNDSSVVPRGGLSYNECWYYVDGSGNEYGIIGSPAEIHVVDVTDPTTPILKQDFQGTFSSIWRDFKSHDNFVYGVHDYGAGTMEGLTILDMSALPNGNIVKTTLNTDFGRAHNIFIDEPQDRLYVAGSDTESQGLIVYDISNPGNPSLLASINLGAYGGYVHDLYVRNNIAYCNSASGENGGMWAYDLGNLNSIAVFAQENTGGYNHSSWMTDDGNHVVYATETSNFPLYIVNVSDVENGNITNSVSFKQPNDAPTHTNNIAHNPLIIGDICYISYYEDGVQLWDISNPSTPTLVGYYDMVQNTGYNGTTGVWGVNPFLPSGNILASEEDGGLYILRYDGPSDIYVDMAANGANNGNSWNDAFTDLQDALAIGAGKTIHIAEGTYYPTSSTSRGATFDIPSDVSIIGGYESGGGTNDPELYETILSGDIDNDGTLSGNSFHVVRIKDATDVSISGLSVKDGNADNANSFGRSRGGGLYVVNSTATLMNLRIEENNAIYGGGLFATTSPVLNINFCDVNNNVAEFGSALYHSNTTNMYISGSRIVDNNSLTRCAIEINNSNYTLIENSIIANNASKNANAIGFIATNRNQTAEIYNTTILGETKNKNLVTMQVGNNDELTVDFYNSIIAHQDINFDKAIVAFNNNLLNLTTDHCYIQGSSVIGNSISNLYSFVDGDLMFNPDYSLDPCSPAVNTGDDANASQLTKDIAGNNRFVGTVDMGAYESQSPCALRQSQSVVEVEAKVYPNPVHDVLNIQTEVEQPRFEIYDVFGRLIMVGNDTSMNVEPLPNGMYQLVIFDADRLVQTEKIIKK